MASTSIAPPLPLPEREVHVWTTRLDAGPPLDLSLLSGPERARARGVRSPARRERWSLARARLRAILARYLALAPERVPLAAGPAGKPRLVPEAVRFNLSHSGEVAVVALTRDREVGMDVERARDGVDAVRLARRALPEAAAAAVAQAAPADRTWSFFAAWSRHEAHVKCLGTGLGAQATAERPVTVLELATEPGHAAALALEGELALAGSARSVPRERAGVAGCRLEILTLTGR